MWSGTAWGATLTWNPNSPTNLAGYRVYQCGQTPFTPSSGNASLLVTLGTGTSFDIGTPAVTMYYFITAYDSANLESAGSNVATVTPAGSPPPPPPGTLPLQFTSTTPETLTTSIQVTVPAGATASTLSVSCFDCDHTDWGSLSINGGAGIALWPGPGPSNASGTIQISVPVSAWRTGSNTLAFTHSQYSGGRVDALSISFTP